MSEDKNKSDFDKQVSALEKALESRIKESFNQLSKDYFNSFEPIKSNKTDDSENKEILGKRPEKENNPNT